jgi:hypothetical protein
MGLQLHMVEHFKPLLALIKAGYLVDQVYQVDEARRLFPCQKSDIHYNPTKKRETKD